MIIKYYGHACFKLRGTDGSVVTDPYHDFIGFDLPNLSADIVTVSHDNPAHNNYEAINNTSRRESPFIIEKPGEYQIQNISIFGVKAYQDDKQGSLRGENYIFSLLVDGLKVCHLGGLGHKLDDKKVAEIGLVDILFLPIGGGMTLNPKEATQVARSLEPNIVIPMIHKLPDHNQENFSELSSLEDFYKAYEAEPKPINKLNIARSNLPEEMELMVLNKFN